MLMMTPSFSGKLVPGPVGKIYAYVADDILFKLVAFAGIQGHNHVHFAMTV
jgi:hypothetical protein